MDMKKKLGEVYARLSLMDQMLLNNYINKESERIVKEIAEDVDYCISATLIESFENLSKQEIRNILDRALIYKEDQHLKAVELKKKYGKGLEEEVERISEQLEKRIRQLVKENVNQNNALKLLKSEFKGIPNATIVNTYKDVKELYRTDKGNNNTVKAEENKSDVEVAAEYIMSDISPISERVITEEPTTKFKIISKSLELEGNFDKYKIENDKLIVKENEYKSLEELEESYERKINALAEEIEFVRNRLIEAKKVFNEFIN